MKQEIAKRSVKCFLGCLMVMLFLSPKLFAQDDLNDLIAQRKNVQKQVDAMAKNDKTFKNKASYADYLSTYKKLMDIDEQIILAANFSMNTLVKERDEALKKAASGGIKTVIKTVPTLVLGKNNDSLANAVTSLQFQTSNLNNVLKAKDEALMRLATKSDSLETENKKFTSQFQALEVDNKNLGEKNLILMIFNSLVVIALIMSLFFLLRKPVAKKLLFNEPPAYPTNTQSESRPFTAEIAPVVATPAPVPVQPPPLQEPERIIRKAPEVTRPEPVFKVSSEGILSGTHDGLDLKLDQIEKLARLKEKGYLTDEEFNTQKRQILGS
jgi:hypothetical protein